MNQKWPTKHSLNMLEILSCTECKGELSLSGDMFDGKLTCTQCHRNYPIMHGIPVMIVDDIGNKKE